MNGFELPSRRRSRSISASGTEAGDDTIMHQTAAAITYDRPENAKINSAEAEAKLNKITVLSSAITSADHSDTQFCTAYANVI